MEKTINPVAEHVIEKFNDHARPRKIFIKGTPCMCTVTYHGKTAQHMAVEAYAAESSVVKDPTRKTGAKKRIKGYLVNMADKKIHFYPVGEIAVHPLPADAIIEKKNRGKMRQIRNKKLA